MGLQDKIVGPILVLPLPPFTLLPAAAHFVIRGITPAVEHAPIFLEMVVVLAGTRLMERKPNLPTR